MTVARDGSRAGARMRWGGAVLLAGLLAACGTTPEPKARAVNQSGYSEPFKQGYSEGCESAGGRGQRRNERRYQTEADYMMGWNDGFSACQRRR